MILFSIFALEMGIGDWGLGFGGWGFGGGAPTPQATPTNPQTQK